MTSSTDVLISTLDAEALASVLVHRGRAGPEAEAAGALADILLDATLVPEEALPADCIALNSRITYLDEPGGTRRTIILVHPREAVPPEGRISVLSPVGRALFGRRSGASASIEVPGGRTWTVRVLGTERAGPARA